MEINTRLKQIRLERGESQTQFATFLGIPQTTYAPYETGKRALPDAIKIKLSKLGINIHWLVTGEGNMVLNTPQTNPTLIEVKNDSWTNTKGQTSTISVNNDNLLVPILKNKVSAGPGEEWDLEDFTEEKLPILKRFVRRFPKEQLFAAEVRGDSMTGVQLFDGDLVVFVSNLIEGDGIYVISVDGELLVKRLEFDHFDKKLIIKSENPRYEVKVVDPERAQILGKVVGWLHHHPY